MKFYDRKEELATLNRIYEQCRSSYGKITVLTGRRRIGKTLLAKKFAENKEHLYLFTSKKAEKLLCEEFLKEYEKFIQEKQIGAIESFHQLFELLLKRGCRKDFVLIIDEFQEFKNVNSSIFSEIQRLWDEYKFKTHVHIIFIGSIYSLMTDIFQNEKEPLYGRADRIMYITPFKPQTIKEILEDHKSYNQENFFYNYLITGGVPRYHELLCENGSFSREEIIDQIFQRDSFFIEEGKSMLVQEFGKEYGVYFSLLELIASGKTSRSEMESILEKSIGGYLVRLENEYDIIRKVKPIGTRKNTRNQKYTIKDNFIRFWFRFIYKNMSIIQDERFGYMKRLVKRDLSTYAGPLLEKLFIEIMSQSSHYGYLGTYWEKGNKNEIDIVAVDDLSQEIYFAEVKLNKAKVRLNLLKENSASLLKQYPDYRVSYEALSLEDIEGKMGL